jgi:hypothetical protein
MNEYIRSRENGVLMHNPLWARAIFNHRWTSHDGSALTHHQLWARVKSLDPEALGNAARAEHVEGRRQWNASAAGFAEFVAGDAPPEVRGQ